MSAAAGAGRGSAEPRRTRSSSSASPATSPQEDLPRALRDGEAGTLDGAGHRRRVVAAWTLDAAARPRVRDSIEQRRRHRRRAGVRSAALAAALRRRRLQATPTTFSALKAALGSAARPAHYLAIPPRLFATVIEEPRRRRAGRRARASSSRSRSAATSRRRVELNAVAHSVFPEPSIFRIDHFLGKEAIRTSSTSASPTRSSSRSGTATTSRASQITLAEDFGVQGARRLLREAGALRDVVENHLFQIVALLAMEPPALPGFAAVHDEKEQVFQAMRPLTPRRPRARPVRRLPQRAGRRGRLRRRDLLRAAPPHRLVALGGRAVVPARRQVPADHGTEVLVELKPPPQRLFADSAADAGSATTSASGCSPTSAIALAARVKQPGEGFVGEQRELYLCEDSAARMQPYERLLGDAMAGDGSLFTRQDAVEAAWAVVGPGAATTIARVRRQYGAASRWGPRRRPTR